MRQWKAPPIEKRWVGIATDTHAELAGAVSSWLSAEGVYFALFEFPSMASPRSAMVDFTADGAFMQLQGRRATNWITNALAGIRPQTILLIGLTDAQKSYLSPLWPAELLIEIDSGDQILDRLPPRSKAAPLLCRRSEIGPGLLRAKSLGVALVCEESAAHVGGTQNGGGGGGIVLIESDGGICDLIAVNYAFSIQADVVFVSAIERRKLEALPRQIEAWSRDRSSPAFREVRREITGRIKDIDFSQYDFATFFTAGLPYGLVLKNTLPCTHVLRGPWLGSFIANTIVQEHRPITFDTALVFSPQLFASEETTSLIKQLEAGHHHVERLLGTEATLEHLNRYGTLFPYDLMHICSHGGETDGWYSKLRFMDRAGIKHDLEFYEVVGHSPAPDEMVRVEKKAIFIALDNLEWRSEPLNMYPKYVFEDMFKAIAENADQTVRKRVRRPIAQSCHIQCYDSIHQGAFQNLAGFGRPVIFNNTCSSSYEMAVQFTAAGARCYIGTLWSVGNTCAMQAADTFYANLLRSANILATFAAMMKSIASKQYRDVYIFWGLHISTFRKAQENATEKLLGALVETYRIWRRTALSAPEQNAKRNSVENLLFLQAQILRRLSPEQREQFAEFRRSQLSHEDDPVVPPDQDEITRTPSELILHTELRKKS